MTDLDLSKVDERIETHGKKFFVTKEEYSKDRIELVELLTTLKDESKANGKKLAGIYKWCGVIGTAGIGALVAYVAENILR